MSGSIGLLKNSLEMLKEKPEMFLPRLTSSLISSILFIAILRGITTSGITILGLITIVATTFFLSTLGIFVWVMLAAMVSEKSSDSLLRDGFLEAVSNLFPILTISILFFILSILVSLPLSIGIAMYSLGSTLGLVLGAILTLSLTLAVGFYSYFLPATVIEHGKATKALKASLQGSKTHKRLVSVLTVFSFTVLGLTLYLTSPSRTYSLGYGLFVLARLVSAVVSTYVFVVSPTLYFGKEEKKN